MVSGANQLVNTRFAQSGILHEELTVISIQLGDLSLKLSGDDQHVLTFFQSSLHGLGILVARGGGSIIDIADVDDRFGGQQLKVLDILFVIGIHLGITGVAHVFKHFLINTEYVKGFFVVLFAILQQLLHAF